jgi:hypothetical protein
MTQIHKFTVNGYKSVAGLENFELHNPNVLISADSADNIMLNSIFRKVRTILATGVNEQ